MASINTDSIKTKSKSKNQKSQFLINKLREKINQLEKYLSDEYPRRFNKLMIKQRRVEAKLSASEENLGIALREFEQPSDNRELYYSENVRVHSGY